MHASRLLKSTPLLAVALICLVGVQSCSAESEKKAASATVGEAAQVVPDVVATVNGVPIKAPEFRRAKKVLEGQQLSAEKRKEIDQLAVAQVISAELLYQAGEKVAPKELEKQVEAKLAESKARFAKKEDFEKSIKALEMNEKELRDYTRRSLIISNFIEQTIAPKITVSEEDSINFYNRNIDKFNRGETVRASHILCGVDAKASAEDKKKAREKAEKLHKQLAGGADFAALAKEHSTCPSGKKGGDLDYFGKGQMVPEFETAAFNLKAGEVSNVIETPFGYHIIKLTDRKAAETGTFKDARPRIEKFLKERQKTVAVSKYVTEERKKAAVEIFLK